MGEVGIYTVYEESCFVCLFVCCVYMFTGSVHDFGSDDIDLEKVKYVISNQNV